VDVLLRTSTFVSIIIVIVLIIAILLPVIPTTEVYYVKIPTTTTMYTYITIYTTTLIPRTTTYTTTATRTFINSNEQMKLKPGEFIGWNLRLTEGTELEIYAASIDHEIEIRVYDYTSYKERKDPLDKIKVIKGTLLFTIPSNGVYVVGIYNPNTGFLGIGGKDVYVERVIVKARIPQTITETYYITKTKAIPTYTVVTISTITTSPTTKTVYKSILQILLIRR